ncbi:MAG: hypothetical protein PHW34_02015 [Hespellia sp.]|nr:hypothetical protein [Hespellia sp.]
MPDFREEEQGYSKTEVDEYLQKFMEEYQILLNELTQEKDKTSGLIKKSKRLIEQNKRLEKENRILREAAGEVQNQPQERQLDRDKRELTEGKDYGEAIAAALISAELSAKRIIDEANRKAELISQSASQNLAKILEAKQMALEGVVELRDTLTAVVEDETPSKSVLEDTSDLFKGDKK